MMNAQGALDGLGAEDAARAERRAKQQELTKRRRGNKGARSWGYATPGSGKRKGRRS